MLIPGILYYIIFHYVPMYGILIGFKDFKLMAGRSYLRMVAEAPWVGFKHLASFFRAPNFWQLVRNTFILSFFSLIFSFPAPIILALALNEVRARFYRRFVQTVSYLPHFLSVVAVVGMMKLMLSPSTGFAATVITWFRGEPLYFFNMPQWFRPLYIGSGIWQGAGWGAIIYLAALAGVSVELYESAVIDGASRLRQIWHITLPTIKPTIVILLILSFSGLFRVGAEKVLLMYSPATYETADVIATYVLRRGLLQQNFSFGAAVGLMNSVINLILLVTGNYVARKISGQSLW